MIDKSLEDGYKNLLKENTRLHAEKKLIVDSAEKAIKRCDEELQKLHDIIGQIVSNAVKIVESKLPDSSERREVVELLKRLAPLRIAADGNERT